MWEKKKNAVCQHFLLFPQCFQKVFPQRLQSSHYVERVKDSDISLQSTDDTLRNHTQVQVLVTK